MEQRDVIAMKAIADKIAYYRAMPPEEALAFFRENPIEASNTITLPTNAHLVCGEAANNSFKAIGKGILAAAPERSSILSLPTLIQSLKREFVARFLLEDRPIDQRNVDKLKSAAYKNAIRKFEVTTHFIPCGLFLSEATPSFEIGPVKFLHRKKFAADFGERINSLRESIRFDHRRRVEGAVQAGFPLHLAATEKDSIELGNRLVDGLLTHFEHFNWVAVVEVFACEDELSYQRAELLVRGALNIVKLLLGSYHTDRLRTAEEKSRSRHAAKLWSTKGELEIALTSEPNDNVLGDKWPEILTGECGWYLSAAGKALNEHLRESKPSHLSGRFIDALFWYGDGVAEAIPASKIVKFVTAMERIVGTGKEDDRGVTDIVVKRATILYARATSKSLTTAKKAIASAYDCRSELVHGSRSPFDLEINDQLHSAEEVTRMILLEALSLFSAMDLQDPKMDTNALKARFTKIEDSAFETLGEATT